MADALKEGFERCSGCCGVGGGRAGHDDLRGLNKTNAHGKAFRSMTTRTTSVQGVSDRGAMPWQLADRNSSWSGGGFFQHSAGRLRQRNEKTLPDSSRSGVLPAGHAVQRLATRTRRHKDKRRKRKPLRRCELTCESLPCKLKSFFKSTTYRSRWRSGRDSNPRPPA